MQWWQQKFLFETYFLFSWNENWILRARLFIFCNLYTLFSLSVLPIYIWQKYVNNILSWTWEIYRLVKTSPWRTKTERSSIGRNNKKCFNINMVMVRILPGQYLLPDTIQTTHFHVVSRPPKLVTNTGREHSSVLSLQCEHFGMFLLVYVVSWKRVIKNPLKIVGFPANLTVNHDMNRKARMLFNSIHCWIRERWST